MNREDLFAAMNGIRDEYIVEADPTVGATVPVMRKLRPLLAMAAVMVLVIGIVSVSGNLFRAKNEAAVPLAREMAVDTTEAKETAGIAESGLGEPEHATVDLEEAAPAEAAPAAEPAEAEMPTVESAEEAYEEAAATDTRQENAEMDQAIEISEIFRDGICYAYDSMRKELPDGMISDGALSDDPSALYYTPFAHSGDAVYFDAEHPDMLAIEWNGEWACYKK